MAIIKTKKADLNIHYKKYFQISVIIVLSLLIMAFKFSPNISSPESIDVCDYGWIELEKTLKTSHTTPQKLPRPPLPELSTNDVPEDLEIETTEIDFEDDLPIPTANNQPTNRIVEIEETEFVAVEEMPTIVGGLASIQKNVYYTEIAKRIGMEGKVIIEFVINKNGDVENAKIFKGIFEELDLIALNAVKQAKFTPGLQRGKPVRVKMWIPIVFKLN